MREHILEMISKGGVSYVELSRIPGFSGGPDNTWAMELMDNLILWSPVSVEAIDILNTLLKEQKITFVPCPLLVYAADGAFLKLPLVKKLQAYKKPHWLPVVWNLVSQKGSN